MTRLKKFLVPVMIVFLLVSTSTLLFAAGERPEKEVTVGAKNFTEQYITGEIVALLLENAGFEVERQFGMSSFALRQAQIAGQVDISNDYTGTGWTTYLNQEETIRDEVALFEAVRDMDLEENDIVWMNRMDLNNTYALAVTNDFAEENGLETLEDLAEYTRNNPGDLQYAVEYEFYERADGFFVMAEEYGMDVSEGDVRTMDLGLTYDAIQRGDVDVSMVFATDGNLVAYDLVVLEDTLAFFPIYNLCNLVRKDVLDQYPEIEEILSPMIHLLDQETMTELNYQVDGQDRETEDVAYDFLVENGLL